ncbi:hypothetical protein K2Y11_12370 [bacterium]|nr:hypothetical protein [bacterium]
MKSAEESGESEKPAEMEGAERLPKHANDTLSIVSYWTRIGIGVALIVLLIALLLPSLDMVTGVAAPWFHSLSRLKAAIQAYNSAFDSPPMGRLADILPLLQLVEDSAGLQKTPLIQMIDENFRDLAFSENPLANEIDSKQLVRFAALGTKEDEDVLYLITSDGSKYAFRVNTANLRPTKSFLDRPVDDIRNEYHAH